MSEPTTTRDHSTGETGSGEIITLNIDRPAHGGAGVARFGDDAGERAGQVVFVRGALPGETGVPVRLDSAKVAAKTRRFLTGELVDAAQISGPSPHRHDAQCEAAAAGAGCCDLDFVDAAGSLEWKKKVVIDQFTRIGHIDLDDVLVSAESLSPSIGYRTRVRLGVDDHGQPGLRATGSREIIPISLASCAQWSPALAQGLAEELDGLQLTPGAEVCVAVGDDGTRSAVELAKEPRAHKTTRGRRDNRRRNGATRRRTHRRVLTGTGSVSHTVNGLSWEVSVESFWQGHLHAPLAYGNWITNILRGSERVEPAEQSMYAWDLYGGAGVFAAAITAALPGVHVDCVDVASEASTAGRHTLNGQRVNFIAGDVAAHLAELRGHDGDLAGVVLDPPRTGAGERVLEGIVSRRPQNILHIGCDPATAARDAQILAKAGYRLASLKIVDAFSLTHHVETLAHYVPMTTIGIH